MKIYTVTDFDVPFEVVSVNYGIEGLSKYIKDCAVHTISFSDMKLRKINRDESNDVLFIFEIGYPQHAGLTAKDLRKWFPNAKFITLCCDTMYYIKNNLPLQLPDQKEEIELTLELNSNCRFWFDEKGIKNDLWMWTISDKLIDELMVLAGPLDFSIKDNDFIGVYHPCSISNVGSYRNNMIKYIKDNGYTFSQGGGTGHNDGNLEKIYRKYISSWFTLGTTSHNRPELTKEGTMKGFRDWIGPILNSLLIYDNHPNVKELFPLHIIPNYEYGDFEKILKLAKILKEEKKLYLTILKSQKQWAKDNTIDKQLYRLLVKHNIVS